MSILGRWLSVWLDDAGVTWDSTMVKLNSKSQVQVLRMQLLFDNASKEFHVWDFQYRHGLSSSKEIKVGLLGDFDLAKQDFLSRFKSFTGLSWNERYSGPHQDSWIPLETSHREIPIITNEIVKLPEQVERVLKIIFESSPLTSYVAALNRRGRSVSFEDKLKKKKFQIGFAVLEKQIKIGISGSTIQAISLAGIYQKLMLPNLNPLQDLTEARKELESLELLLKLQDASEILKNSQSSSMALSQISQVLGLAKMEPGTNFCTSLSLI